MQELLELGTRELAGETDWEEGGVTSCFTDSEVALALPPSLRERRLRPRGRVGLDGLMALVVSTAFISR